MSTFFNREDSENIAMMNMMMGSKHRTMPYDLTNSDDLKQLLLYTVAAYMDYDHYWLELETLMENMDESLEYYDPATWLNMSLHPEKIDELATDAIVSLRETADLFSQLSKRAKKNLAGVLKIMLSLPEETQTKVLGGYYNISADKLDEAVSELLDDDSELDYHYNMEDNRDEFLKHLKNVLDSFEL